VPDQSQGAQLDKLQGLVRYWGTDYDWRRAEAKLNALPQFITEIDGLNIYFIHVRSRHDDAIPLIVTHGWPGSVLRAEPGDEQDQRDTPPGAGRLHRPGGARGRAIAAVHRQREAQRKVADEKVDRAAAQ
jgi:Epoxide hydrolase N terminus